MNYESDNKMKKKIFTSILTGVLAVSMLGIMACGTDATTSASKKSDNEVAVSAMEENTESVTTEEQSTGSLDISSLEELEPGSYTIEAELSCYLPAMGGCDFGQGLLESAVLAIAEDETASITLDFKELVTVTMMYGDATSYAAEGETAYFDGSDWIEAEYTTVTATSSELSTMGETESDEPVEIEYTYIDTMTFPITEMADTYILAVNVGGTQFGGETAYTLSSTGESLNAELSVYWNGNN